MTQLNGINYTEMLLTDEELAVVKAMRMGAKVSVSFHKLNELSQVDEGMDLFAKIPRTGASWIDFNKQDFGEKYLSFVKQMKNVTVACFLDIKKD